MTAEEMGTGVKRELGRPADDDRHPTEDLSAALKASERSIKRQLGMRQHTRQVLVADLSPVAADDATGATYTLAGTPIYLELWTPPGWNGGRQLYPAARGNRREGFFLLGSVVHLTRPFVYTPGLYAYGVLDSAAVNLEATPKVNSSLPDFLHEPQVLYAAAELARRPHSRVDAKELMMKANDKLAEVLTTQVFALPGIEFESDPSAPWWRSPDFT